MPFPNCDKGPKKGYSSESSSEDDMMTESSIYAYYKNCFMLSKKLKLMADLMKTPGHADLLQDKDQEQLEAIIPERLFLFLNLLFEGMDILGGLAENLLEP